MKEHVLKDYLGQELIKGDNVVFISAKYNAFRKAVIVELSNYNIRLAVKRAKSHYIFVENPVNVIKITKEQIDE